MFWSSSNERHWDEPPFTMLEKIIRTGYHKPVDEFDFHIHYHKKCTGHTDVPPTTFDLQVQFESLFPLADENRKYYLCFIPKSNPPARLPATPISEQSGASPVPDVAVQSAEHEHLLKNTDGIEAGLYSRRAATAPAPAQLSALRRGVPTSLPIHPRTKRPIEGDPDVQEENKRPRITDEARVIVGLSHDQPGVPKIERIQDGLPGSRADPIVIPEPAPADPHQQAYNFFLAHKLPHVFRFEVGIVNPDKIPDTWERDKEGRLNKVSVHLETTGRRLVFLLLDRDKDNAYLERPSHSRINMNVVNFLPAIKHLQHKEHLKSFLRSYGPALRRGDPFETASIVDLGSDKGGDDEYDHESIRSSNEAHKTVSAMPKASKIVTLRIEPNKLATFIEKIHRSGCTNCKKDKKDCEPLEWGAYLGCMRCKGLGLICSLSSIREDPGTSLPRAAKAKLHRSLREMQNGMGHGTMSGAHPSEMPPSGSYHEVQHGSDQITASDGVERQELSRVSDRPPIPGGADLMGGGSLEEDEHRMLYGVTPPRSQNARVNLKITFEDQMKIPDNSRPLNFGPWYAQAVDTWTASAVVDRVLRKQIEKAVLDTPKKRLGNQHKNDLLVADLTVWLVLGGGLAPRRKLLFRSFDLGKSSSSSENGWLEKAVERGFLKVHDGCTVELNVEMFSKEAWRGEINPIKRDR
ncbi:hypothetical protein BFW01_g12546 [Lasiodiplodia theobromae]|nr:hypothetical protein BFW01_g12546 [Lasiodiplodia theobromae]